MTQNHFFSNNGRGLLDKYNGSPGACVITSFPSHQWIAWKFSFRNLEMHSKKEILDLVDELEKENGIEKEKLDGWYGFSINSISDPDKLEFIKEHGGLHGILPLLLFLSSCLSSFLLFFYSYSSISILLFFAFFAS